MLVTVLCFCHTAQELPMLLLRNLLTMTLGKNFKTSNEIQGFPIPIN